MFFPTSRQQVESSSSSSSSSELPQPCRQFTFSEIQLATQKLDESLIIGRGGCGKVYKGTITNGPNSLTAAIKRLDSTSNQGASEFWAEVNMLSSLRHCHLVSLIGYCNDGQEMILVYEYMSHGTLEDHLHRCQTRLSWVQRLTICIGAARGLDYLHTGTGIKHGVVHRDVKSSNILLHDSWAAKISDFGLSKICPKNKQITYVNTGVKGTFGYLDPDYFYTGNLTRKSDVYAFGVVLFEVLCGKQAVDRSIGEEQLGLIIWAQDSIKQGKLKDIVDTNIRGSIPPKCLKEFAKLAQRCLHKHPKQRPTMAEVVVGLESILALPEKASNSSKPTSMQFFAKKALTVISGGRSLNSLELYFDTVGGENQRLHRFDLDTLMVATENFAKANIIPQLKAHASLYKGKLQNGQGIALVEPIFGTRYKEDHMNEASILVKLEHENVVKLLGYCIEGTRLFLVYDFAPHATLDQLMFGPGCTILNWDKRYKIILVVARALLYLHKHAPICTIHCDVNIDSILLDEGFDPKLSYFWCATNINETGCIRVDAIRDTIDYMAPEYTLFGTLSTKTDVYSFGVVVLETVTGHRVSSDIGLLNYVQRNWLEGTLSDIIDPRTDADPSLMTSFIEVGLLCIQIYPDDRPTMEEVVTMLLRSSSFTIPVLKMRARMRGQPSDVFDSPVPGHLVGEVEDCVSKLRPL